MQLTPMAAQPYIDELSKASALMDAPRYMSAWAQIDNIRTQAFLGGLHHFCSSLNEALQAVRMPEKPNKPELTAHYVDFMSQIVNTFDTNDARIDSIVGITDEMDELLAQKIDALNIYPASRLGSKLKLIATYLGEDIAHQTIERLIAETELSSSIAHNTNEGVNERDIRIMHLVDNVKGLWAALESIPTFEKPLPDMIDDRLNNLYLEIAGTYRVIAKTKDLDHLLSMNLRKTLGSIIIHRECREIDTDEALSRISNLTPAELMAIIIKQVGGSAYAHDAFERLFNHEQRTDTKAAMSSLRLLNKTINVKAKAESGINTLIDHLGIYLQDKNLNDREQESLNWMLDGILQRMVKEYRTVDRSVIILHKMLNSSRIRMEHQFIFQPIASRKRTLIELDLGMR